MYLIIKQEILYSMEDIVMELLENIKNHMIRNNLIIMEQKFSYMSIISLLTLHLKTFLHQICLIFSI